MHTVLLLGERPRDPSRARKRLDPAIDVQLLAGTSTDDVLSVLHGQGVDTVILEAGLDPNLRIEAIRHILSEGDRVSIHVAPPHIGDDGFMPFVNGVLTGLTWHRWEWTESGAVQDRRSPSSRRSVRSAARPGVIRRAWDYLFGRSEPPHHPPPPPHSPGAGFP